MKYLNQFLNHSKSAALALIFFSFLPCLKAVDIDSSYSEPLIELETLKIQIQKNAVLLLQIAKNANENDYGTQVSTIQYLRIISGNCALLENQFDTDLPIYRPNINDEFLLLQEDDDWLQVRLPDGREAWISEECIQRFNKTTEKKLGKLTSMTRRNDQIGLANYIIEELRVLSEEAEKKSARIRKSKKSSEADLILLKEINASINKYKTLGESAFALYILPEKDNVNYADLLNKLSLNAELQVGSSDFTRVRNEFSETSQAGLISDFLFDLEYRINQFSRAQFYTSRSNEIVQTPYSNTEVGARYNGKWKNFNWNTGLTYSKYNDKLNTFNRFNRVGFNFGANQKLNRKTTIQYSYLVNANNYSDFEGINFTNHNVNVNSRTIINSTKTFDLALRANAQQGQEERRNFIFLYPEARYTIKKQRSSNQYFINYQRYAFENLGLRDTDRLMLGIRKNKTKGEKNSSRYLALSSKSFINKPEFNFLQVDTRINNSRSGKRSGFVNTGLRINYYPLQTNLNFADVQFSFGNRGELFYNFSTFNRFYYSSEPLINIFDLNLRTGVRIMGFSFGPSISAHALINAEGFEFRQDGNFYRLGAYAEGNVRLPFQTMLSLMTAYDYGFVYSQQFSQDAFTGELMYGDVNERHPTTFQLNSTISTSIIRNVDLFFRLEAYVIDSDITAVISRDPIEQNRRFTARLGARYRFN